MRRSTFTVDAESVQGNAGAEVTFKPLTVGERQDYFATPGNTDGTTLAAHIVAWSGIVDDDGNEMPSPADEPGIVDKLYLSEAKILTRFLFTGAPVPQVPN